MRWLGILAAIALVAGCGGSTTDPRGAPLVGTYHFSEVVNQGHPWTVRWEYEGDSMAYRIDIHDGTLTFKSDHTVEDSRTYIRWRGADLVGSFTEVQTLSYVAKDGGWDILHTPPGGVAYSDHAILGRLPDGRDYLALEAHYPQHDGSIFPMLLKYECIAAGCGS